MGAFTQKQALSQLVSNQKTNISFYHLQILSYLLLKLPWYQRCNQWCFPFYHLSPQFSNDFVGDMYEVAQSFCFPKDPTPLRYISTSYAIDTFCSVFHFSYRSLYKEVLTEKESIQSIKDSEEEAEKGSGHPINLCLDCQRKAKINQAELYFSLLSAKLSSELTKIPLYQSIHDSYNEKVYMHQRVFTIHNKQNVPSNVLHFCIFDVHFHRPSYIIHFFPQPSNSIPII